MDFRFCTKCNIFFTSFESFRNILLCDRLRQRKGEKCGNFYIQKWSCCPRSSNVLLPTSRSFSKIPIEANREGVEGGQHKHRQRIPENLMIYFKKSRQLFCYEMYWREAGTKIWNRMQKKKVQSVNKRTRKIRRKKPFNSCDLVSFFMWFMCSFLFFYESLTKLKTPRKFSENLRYF